MPKVFIISRAINHHFWESLAAFQRAKPFQIIDQTINKASIIGLITNHAGNACWLASTLTNVVVAILK